MVDIEQIKGLTFQKRMVEAFKAVRKDGIKARLGPDWSAQRKLQREPHWTFVRQYEYADMNGWGRQNLRLNCDSGKTAERVAEILNNYGITATADVRNQRVNTSGIDDTLIGKKELELAMKNLTREVLVETYSLD
jgi:hypothetical protein